MAVERSKVCNAAGVLLAVAGTLLLGGLLSGCSSGEAPADSTEAPLASEQAAGSSAESASPATGTDEVAACAERGVAYFKEIGSYPTLTSAPNAGRAAEDVALERCRRTATAF